MSREHLAGLFREWGSSLEWEEVVCVAAATEGERRLRTHYAIERKAWIINKKKRLFREKHGRLFCEVCKTNYETKYGERWNERAIEAHHIKPLAQLDAPTITEQSDLILICANCHRLVHQAGDVVENLRQLIEHFDV